MKLVQIICIVLGLSAPAIAEAPAQECVILLHGLARTDTSLEVAETVLERAGYFVVNQRYDSTAKTIPELARATIPAARNACAKVTDAPPFALTHSMGGIVLRLWAEAHPQAPWARVVMLAPPNQGSELVDAFSALQPFALINGPGGLQLGTGPDSVPASLGPLTLYAGIIAGDRSLNAFYSTILPGPDDGKVTVASTKVEGMRDHLVLPLTHTFLMNAPMTLAQTLRFYETGGFDPDLDIAQALGPLVIDGTVFD